MRSPLRRKAVTIIAVIMSFTAIPAAGIVANAAPALASGDICLTYGNGCAGGADIDIGSYVVLTSTGRRIDEVAQNYKCCGGYEVFQLRFADNTARCIGVNGGIGVTVRDCSGGNTAGVNWAREPGSSGIVYWWNNPKQGYLSSDNYLGDGLFVSFSSSGTYQAWNG
jgi:hypothetical protein